MKPGPIFGLALVGIGLGLLLIGAAPIGIPIMLGGVITIAVTSGQKSDGFREDKFLEEAGTEGRRLLRGVVKERNAIAEMASKSTDVVVKGTAAEAMSDVQDALDAAHRLARRRSELRSLIREGRKAKGQLDQLELRINSAQTDEEREILERSRDSLQRLLESPAQAEEEARRLEAMILEIQTGLSELRMGLTMRRSLDVAETDQDLRGILGRLQSVSASAREADDFLDMKL